jgi:hypothetical protein
VKAVLVAILVAGSASHLAAQSVPYAIDVRRQPRGTFLDSLLPRSVGPFRRAPFAPRTPIPDNEALKIDYGAGADTISLTFRIPGNPDDAQEGVKRAREDAKDRKIDVKRAEYVSRQDPSYFRAERLMAWSRGGYFFGVDAPSRDALDRFMLAFPY